MEYISLCWYDIPELVAPLYGVYISQLIRYSRACGSSIWSIYLSVDTIFQSLWLLYMEYISLSWYDIPELVAPLYGVYISQLIRYSRACGSSIWSIYLSVDTIFQSLWLLYMEYISLSWYDIPELVAPLYGVYISQLIRYSRACGSSIWSIYLSVDTIFQSLWLLYMEYISLSWYDIPELVAPLYGVYISQLYDIPELVAPLYGVYISQLIRYSRACGSSQDFLDRWLLLTRKLSYWTKASSWLSWSHHFGSSTVATMTWLTIME